MSSLSDTAVGIASTLGSGAVLGLLGYLRSHNRDHAETRERLERIEAEFHPNAGSSARDLQEELLTTMRHIAAAQGVQLPPRRSRPRPHREEP